MSQNKSTRRTFIKAAVAASAAPYIITNNGAVAQETKKNERLVIGAIGTGSRANAVVRNAMKFGDVVAVCDVDANRAKEANGKYGQGKAEVVEDYRKVLDRKDIDAVTIVTTDHWHTKIAIEAMQAGKDVYCEKPLTLTIDEGKKICQVAKETGRVFQVGTQQRSEMGLKFLTAVAIAKSGRLGEIKKVQCGIGGSPTSGPIAKADVPAGLNWDMWLGQAPLVDYRWEKKGKNAKTRCHYEFRWWYEYSGGKLTDWGAHHVDIATWAIGMDQSGPLTLEGTSTHPVPFKDGYPTQDDQYNCATAFNINVVYPNGVEMVIRHDDRNGILIEGTKGKIFVSRGKLEGKPVDELKDNPLPEDALTKLYKGKQPGDHMRNFVECVKDRSLPISDVFTHHRALTTCHLANIAIRLDRPIKWDAGKEQIVGDEEANQWQERTQRKGYEIKV